MPPTLRIGYVPGVTLTKWRRIWGERYRETLDVTPVVEAAQRSALLAGEVDMCFVRLPIERDELHVIPLYEEQPVLWLSKGHPLAERDEVSTADLDGHNVLTVADEASIELASYSAAVLRVPLSVARSGSRKDFVHLNVTDAPATTVGLAWRIANEHPLIEEFIGVVRGRTVNSTRGGSPTVAPKKTRAVEQKHSSARQSRGRRRRQA